MGREFEPALAVQNISIAIADLVFLQGFTLIQGMAKWARPSPAAGACAVTSQSYCVHPVIPAASSSSTHLITLL